MFCVQKFGTQWEEEIKQNFYKIGSHYRSESDVYNPARYDITTFINDSDIKLEGIFTIATSILGKQTADNFIKTYKTILQQFAELSTSKTPSTTFKVQDIKFIDSNDFKGLLHRNFIPGKDQAHTAQNAFELFYTHVLRNPSNIAITFQGVSISYEELNNRVCIVAEVLKKLDNNIHNKVIAVFLERSIDSIVSLLTIIKLGAIYLPIDTNLPKQRLDYILEDSKCNVIISSSTVKDKLLNSALTILQIDGIVNNSSRNSNQNINVSEVTDIAYMIYTSGSTGNPKGVLVTHLNLINFLQDMQRRFSLKIDDSFLAVTTFSFDISLLEILLPLTSGTRLVLCSKEQ
jgi:non-ribosomal peptide synthetase component F